MQIDLLLHLATSCALFVENFPGSSRETAETETPGATLREKRRGFAHESAFTRQTLPADMMMWEA